MRFQLGTVNLTSQGKGDEGVSISDMMDIEKDKYNINTLGRFTAKIYRDSNEEVRLIVFTQPK